MDLVPVAESAATTTAALTVSTSAAAKTASTPAAEPATFVHLGTSFVDV